MRAVWIALGTGGIGRGNGTREQRNAGCDKRRKDGADERNRFYAIGFDEMAKANKTSGTRHLSSEGTN
jgi:hypothetical protein